MTIGEFLSELIFQYFRSECGPFGDEDPERLSPRTIALHSQAGHSYYTFNDDLSVDYKSGEDQIHELSFVWDNDIPQECISYHYDTILDLINSDDGWFYTFDNTYTIKNLLEDIIKKENE